jgi:hypothetical protein
MGAGDRAAASLDEAGEAGERRHGGRRQNILPPMSESGAPPRIQGTGPKQMESHEFFRRGECFCPKSDTACGNDGTRSGMSETHGGARI